MIYYTDGSCRGNGKALNKGGNAYVCLNNEGTFITAMAEQTEGTTNNREELKAILGAMEHFSCYGGLHQHDGYATIYSDSSYCINVITKWMEGWRAKGWIKSDKLEPENLDLIRLIYTLYNEYHFKFVKVKGHSGDTYNEMVDKLATGTITIDDLEGGPL